MATKTTAKPVKIARVTSNGSKLRKDIMFIDDFQEWFKKYDRKKDGDLAVIHFTEMRYATSKPILKE